MYMKKITLQGLQMPETQISDNPSRVVRRDAMGLLARSPLDRLSALMPETLPAHDFLRIPEVGTVMLQGRTGATGAPFNLGEMTVTRCTVQLASGEIGHGNVQGRDKGHATRAALIDALLQTAVADELRSGLLAVLAAEEAARNRGRAERAAATKVEFFTLVRGEDQ